MSDVSAHQCMLNALCHSSNACTQALILDQPSTSGGSLGRWLETFDPAAIRCPFFRRRAIDLLESAAQCGQWLAARHKSVDLTFGLLPLRTVAAGPKAAAAPKAVGLPAAALASQLAHDFSARQCQVTGRLSRELFEENCLFCGPDPDMPVRGLGKFLSASQQLFSHARSKCELLAVGVVDSATAAAAVGSALPAAQGGGRGSGGTDPPPDQVVVVWRIEGTVNLPWHPEILPYFGVTLYEVRRRGAGKRETRGSDDV